jgi:hypothetical protein
MTDERGSTRLLTKLFDTAPTDEELRKALDEARDEFRVLRWWKYGQPATDVVKATLDVRPEMVGTVVGDLFQLYNEKIRISLEGFPYGVVAIDGVQLQVTLEQQAGD